MGYEVRLVPPFYVKAYVKRGKSDALDAEAICEAVQRPTMRFVPVKMLANALRDLAELGFVTNPGIANLAKLAEQAPSDDDALPIYARTSLGILVRRIMGLNDEVAALDRQLITWHAENEASRGLLESPASA